MRVPPTDRNHEDAAKPKRTKFRNVYLYVHLPSDTSPADVFDDDWSAPGVYEVQVPADFSDAFAANTALAGFNSRVPIKRLYMFEFTVRDPQTGDEIDPDFSRDYYEFADRCGRVKRLGHLG